MRLTDMRYLSKMLNIHSMLERTAIINMKKSMVSLALAAAILASGTLANADALKDSAPIVNADTLSVHESFDHDEESGAWTLVTNRTQAALDALSNGYGCSSSGSTLFMYVTLKGNTLDNTVTPTLNVCSIGSTVINANAVSLLIDGVRYDFETETEVGAIGDYRAEIMSAPLNTDGIVMLGAMVESDKLMVLLHGSEKVNEYTIKTSSTSSERAQMQAASIDCVRDALDIYSALGTGANSERAINDWEDETGLTCAYVAVQISEQPRVSLTLDEDFDVLKLGDSTSSVRKLQQLLCDAGYMYVEPASRYTDQTRAAVLRAQHALGFVATGSADAALIDALGSGVESDEPDYASEDKPLAAAEGEMRADADISYEIADEALVELNSYRFSKRISPSNGGDTSAVSVSDSDNVLIVFEGSMENLSNEEKDIAWDYTAELTLDGKYEYECTFAVEQNDGEKYGTSLLPMGGGKLVVYAEVPASLMNKDCTWTLEIKIGTTTLTYTAE